jgi:hypothetical protein
MNSIILSAENTKRAAIAGRPFGEIQWSLA